MSESNSKPAFYDYPLYMRLIPWLRNEYIRNPRKRDAFEDFITLYSVFVFYGIAKPNRWYGGHYW